MGPVNEALDRLLAAIGAYEARQRAKELVSAVLGAVPAIIPGFPPVPGMDWTHSEAELHEHIDTLEYEDLMGWAATCQEWEPPSGGGG